MSLPQHRASDWIVLVIVEGTDADHADQDRSYMGKLASDLTAGMVDVPGSKWRCRFDHVHVYKDVAGLLTRQIACSVDDWQTYVVAVASNDDPHSAKRAHFDLTDTGKAVQIELCPCTKKDPCPATGDAFLNGQVRLRVQLLPGDPPPTTAR